MLSRSLRLHSKMASLQNSWSSVLGIHISLLCSHWGGVMYAAYTLYLPEPFCQEASQFVLLGTATRLRMQHDLETRLQNISRLLEAAANKGGPLGG